MSVYVGWVGGDGGTAHAHRVFVLRFCAFMKRMVLGFKLFRVYRTILGIIIHLLCLLDTGPETGRCHKGPDVTIKGGRP